MRPRCVTREGGEGNSQMGPVFAFVRPYLLDKRKIRDGGGAVKEEKSLLKESCL